MGGTGRQYLPLAYRRSSDIYAMTRDTIMGGSLYGEHQVGIVVPKERYVDIDEPFDWVRAEYVLEQLKQKGYEF